MARRRSIVIPVLLLLICLVVVGWIENPADYEPIQPGPNAPVYVNWRTGQLVSPGG
jgi:lipopolysaccharide export system protein LptC